LPVSTKGEDGARGAERPLAADGFPMLDNQGVVLLEKRNLMRQIAFEGDLELVVVDVFGYQA
jgi:hypothetical protein